MTPQQAHVRVLKLLRDAVDSNPPYIPLATANACLTLLAAVLTDLPPAARTEVLAQIMPTLQAQMQRCLESRARLNLHASGARH
jgi:hypothetical protein